MPTQFIVYSDMFVFVLVDVHMHTHVCICVGRCVYAG
jgi:hypothetical protein